MVVSVVTVVLPPVLMVVDSVVEDEVEDDVELELVLVLELVLEELDPFAGAAASDRCCILLGVESRTISFASSCASNSASLARSPMST